MKNAAATLFKILLFASLVLIFAALFYLFRKVDLLSSTLVAVQSQNAFSVTPILQNKLDSGMPTIPIGERCDESCKSEINRLVSEATATLSATRVVTTTASSPKTDYISMGTTYTTTSTDWVTIEDSATYIDLVNDYGKNAKVSWETSLKVAHGNGQAYARLYDDTNKIAVNFSELITVNNDQFKQVSSGNLPFWRGRNLYKVQIKSLNSFEVTYSGGKIKVSY